MCGFIDFSISLALLLLRCYFLFLNVRTEQFSTCEGSWYVDCFANVRIYLYFKCVRVCVCVCVARKGVVDYDSKKHRPPCMTKK